MANIRTINHTLEKGPANLQSPLNPKPSRDGGGSKTMTEHEKERGMGHREGSRKWRVDKNDTVSIPRQPINYFNLKLNPTQPLLDWLFPFKRHKNTFSQCHHRWLSNVHSVTFLKLIYIYFFNLSKNRKKRLEIKRTLRIRTSEKSFFTLQTRGLVLRGRLLVVDHTLDDAMDRVQEVGVLAHGQ